MILHKISKHRYLTIEVKEALKQKSHSLFIQPLMDLSTGKIYGGEFLLRLRGRDGQIIHPEVFMPTIERSRYLVNIDEWVLGEALRLITSFGHEVGEIGHLRFSINISSAILFTKKYGRKCLSKILKEGISPSSLMLEVTEKILFPSHGEAIESLMALHTQGVNIAIDDFGVGYSNLQQLSTLPISFLKIDKSLVTGVHDDPKGMTILKAALGIGKNLGLKIIAEGVESREDEEMIRSLGCPLVQGFLYGQPLPAEEFAEVLKKTSLRHHTLKESILRGPSFISGDSGTVRDPGSAHPTRRSAHHPMNRR